MPIGAAIRTFNYGWDIFQKHQIYYERVEENLRREEKLKCLADRGTVGNIDWETITPDQKFNWIQLDNGTEFEGFISLGTKEAKRNVGENVSTIFAMYGRGVATNADPY